MRYLFELGSHPLLSQAEIEQSIKGQVSSIEQSFLIFETDRPIDCSTLIHRLGGTIKIGEEIAEVKNAANAIVDYLLETRPDGKVEFSLSGNASKRLGIEVKKILKAAGRSVRYIEPKNTATILHNGLVESGTDVTIVGNTLFVTKAIQPIEELSNRDYGRPGRDDRSGMLPPKLAKMLINLTGLAPSSGPALLDPYCGSGTILTEALLMGFTKLFGTDVSSKAIADTKENLAWMQNEYGLDISHVKVVQSDVRSLGRVLKKEIDAIIFEPYMGKPLRGSESKHFISRHAEELAELYIQAFSAFKHVLQPESVVVGIIPEFHVQSEWMSVPCREQIKKIGFTPIPLLPEHESLLYHRSGQHVGRMISKWISRN